MTEDDVVAIDDPRASSEWRVHAAIYEARPDVRAIVHTHSPHATERSERGVGDVPVAAWAETGTSDLAAHVVTALAAGDAVLMARHGVVGVGATLDDALRVCAEVEAAARSATP
jgi:L-fuculose-phosphate aldolase